MKVWVDGQWCDFSRETALAGTPAFQFGFGLFETIRIRAGLALDLQDHCNRMAGSIAALGPDRRGFDREGVFEAATAAAKAYSEADGVLKIIAYRAETDWRMLFLSRPFPYGPNDYIRGWSLVRSQSLRNPTSKTVSHKTLNCLENYLERQRAQTLGYDDAYFLNPTGLVTESTAANVFLVRNGELRTPPVTAGLLPGVMRAKVLRAAPQLGLEAVEAAMAPEALIEADTVLVTNALLSAMPVRAIDGVNRTWDQSFVTSLNKALDR